MKFASNNDELTSEDKSLRQRKRIIRWLLSASVFLLLITCLSLWLAMQQAHIFSKVRYYSSTWHIGNVSSELYRLMLAAHEVKPEADSQDQDELALRLDVLYGVLDNSLKGFSGEMQLPTELSDVESALNELQTAVIRWSDIVAQAGDRQQITQAALTILKESQPLRLKINIVVSKVNQTYNQKEVEHKHWLGELFSIFSLTLFFLLIGVVIFIWRSLRDGQITESIAETLRLANHNLEERVRERTIALQKIASTDELTGIYNRRAFFDKAEQLLSECNLSNIRCGVLMLDIDFFKSVNDQHGHLAGDEVIKNVGLAMRTILRKPAVFGRIGGEEFAAILPAKDSFDLLEIAKCMRSAIADDVVTVAGNRQLHVTVSIGVTLVDNPQQTLTHLLSQADFALYNAKRNGRNIVTLFE